jgi:RND family efflux transporter MFP subunit
VRKRSNFVPKPVWWTGLAVVVVVLLAITLHIHPLDTWMHRLLGHQEEMTAARAGNEEKQLWTCAMHPQIIEDHPGKCPICGMTLVPVKGSAGASPAREVAAAASPGAAAGPKGERKVLFYRNPMDPTITSPVPAKDDMGMDYVPVYADEAEKASAQGATVTIDPTVEQNMNVVTAKVTRRDVTRQIRTVGYLDYDQEKMVSVTTKYPGFIEKAFVNYIGQPVRKGEPLFDIYSPELVQTEQELLSALDFAERMKGAPEDARNRAEALVDAAKTRLAYWDISKAQVERLARTGEVLRTLEVSAPSNGVVMMRMPGLEGMAVKPGMELLHIADLSTLWLTVEVFEDQLPWVHVGSPAEVALTYFPGEKFTGKVRFIKPEVSEKTRSVQLTLEVPNGDGRLRAGMYATVVFEPVAVRDAITVPSQAVLRTGERNVVVVALGGGRFAPRDVVLGPQGDGFVQVLSGLHAGEEVVTSAQFLIDSESNLREAIQHMIEAKRQAAQGGGDAQ